MPPSPTLAARDRRILTGYAAGTSIVLLAYTEDIDPAIVRSVLRRAGVRLGRRNPLPSAVAEHLSDPAWLAAEYAEKTGTEIAEELGCTAWAVYRALQAADIPRRGPGEYVSKARGGEPWSAEAADEVIEGYATGESAPAIAEVMEVPIGRVYKLLRERGALRSLSKARELEEARRRLLAKQEQRDAEQPSRHTGDSQGPDLPVAEVLERYAAGESAPSIANELVIGQGRVYRLLRERGVLRTIGEARQVQEKRRQHPESARH